MVVFSTPCSIIESADLATGRRTVMIEDAWCRNLAVAVPPGGGELTQFWRVEGARHARCFVWRKGFGRG